MVDETSVAAQARQKSMPFFLISFFSLTMSVFIIFSSYKVITLDRLPVIDTFRSIGATRKTVSRILLLESLPYGCAGGLLGIPPGILVQMCIRDRPYPECLSPWGSGYRGRPAHLPGGDYDSDNRLRQRKRNP